jgi:hypothetical protein
VTVPLDDAALDALEPQGRARIDALLGKRWMLPGEHPLARLHGVTLDLRDASSPRSDDHLGARYRLLALLGPKNNVGSRYFQLWLADENGRLGGEALALGLHNSGRFPAFNWIELTQYHAVQRFGETVFDIAADGLDLALFQALSPFAPPGGHMMVEYDSPSQRASERLLTLAYPQVTSPLGYLLFQVGCRSYRDWYISEGGREGPRKLQAFKPFNEQIAREKEDRLREELTAFLAKTDRKPADEWGEVARRTAKKILSRLS